MRNMLLMVSLILSAPTTGAIEPEPGPEPTPEPVAEFEPAAEAAPPGTPFAPWTHTRALSPEMVGLLAEAGERSAIVVSLLRQLEQTNVVVYVTDTSPWSVTNPASYMVFLSRQAGMRYVLVRIARWGLSPVERIVLLGHELQHALEVAAAPEVEDESGLARLYARIGWSRGKGKYESEAAQTISLKVRRELSRN